MAKHFASETGTVRNIPLGLVRALPQVRTQFKEASIQELAADIQAHGLLQPLVVRPDGDGYTVVIGERRFRACQLLKAEYVPAIVADIAEDQREEIQLIENIQREDLSAKDLSGSILKLWKRCGSVAEVARRCAKSKSWVSKRLAVAMDVGPLTAQLLDANTKDAELLYTFATLEKADTQRARALLPDVLDKHKTRKDVQHELAVALGKKADKPEENADTKTMDMFADMTPARQNQVAREQAEGALAIALEALRAIVGTATAPANGDANQLKKLASEALDSIGAMP